MGDEMKKFIFYIKLYLKIISQYFKARMQYRVDFIISSFGIIITNISGIFILYILFKSIKALEDWSLYELVFLYAFSLMSLSPLQMMFDNVWDLRRHVAEGTFIKYYFRPINMMFYYMSEIFDLKGISQFIFAIILLIYSSMKLGLEWSLLAGFQFFSLWMCASLIMISLMIIAAASAFWIINSLSILSFFFKFQEFSKYPLSIFNSFFQFFFTFIIPIGFVAFYPVRIILKPESSGWLIYFSPAIGIGLFIFAYFIWKKGVNAYTGTGS